MRKQGRRTTDERQLAQIREIRVVLSFASFAWFAVPARPGGSRIHSQMTSRAVFGANGSIRRRLMPGWRCLVTSSRKGPLMNPPA